MPHGFFPRTIAQNVKGTVAGEPGQTWRDVVRLGKPRQRQRRFSYSRFIFQRRIKLYSWISQEPSIYVKSGRRCRIRLYSRWIHFCVQHHSTRHNILHQWLRRRRPWKSYDFRCYRWWGNNQKHLWRPLLKSQFVVFDTNGPRMGFALQA